MPLSPDDPLLFPAGQGDTVRTAAYLDSNSVSMVTSAVVAGVAGIVVVLKMGFRRIVGVFSPSRRAALRAAKQDSATSPTDG